MQFNQINKNRGDVNNAVSEKGTVVQAVGNSNTVKVEQPKKEGFWITLWSKVKSAWTWVVGLFGGA
jgi:hypothetical protein